MINIFLRRLLQLQTALSLIELLVALPILALLSRAGLKMFQSTQTSFVDGRISLLKAKRNDAIAAFIYNDFVDKALPPSTAPRLYVNSQMPDGLQAAEKLAVAVIFGTGSRFQFAAPKCRLPRDAGPDPGNVSSPSDCMRFGQTTFAQRVNQIPALGADIVFSIDGTSTRCSISRPLEGTDVGDMAVAHVDDSLCLRMANNLQNVLQTGDHIMLPRFVVYNSVDPASCHTSFIENVSASKSLYNWATGFITNAVCWRCPAWHQTIDAIT